MTVGLKRVSRKRVLGYQRAKRCFLNDDRAGASKHLLVLLEEYENHHEKLPFVLEKLLRAVLLRDRKVGFDSLRGE